MRAGFLSRILLELFVAMLLTACVNTAPNRYADDAGPREDCRAEEAQQLDVTGFIANPERFIRRCIRVRGIIAFRQFFPDVASMYKANMHSKDVIGIYGSADSLWEMRKSVELIAYTYTCDELGKYAERQTDRANREAKAQGRDSVTISFISGECHYHDGPILLVSHWQETESNPPRLYGAENALRYGDLIPIRDDWEHASEVKNFSREWFDGIRKQDANILYSAAQSAGISRFQASTAEKITHAKDSPYASLFGATKAPLIEFFRLKIDAPDNYPDGAFFAFGCVCRAENCSGMWPIATAMLSIVPTGPTHA